MRPDGKAAIMTGAAGGLGEAIARRYAEAGAKLPIADVDWAAAHAERGRAPIEAMPGAAF